MFADDVQMCDLWSLFAGEGFLVDVSFLCLGFVEDVPFCALTLCLKLVVLGFECVCGCL